MNCDTLQLICRKNRVQHTLISCRNLTEIYLQNGKNTARVKYSYLILFSLCLHIFYFYGIKFPYFIVTKLVTASVFLLKQTWELWVSPAYWQRTVMIFPFIVNIDTIDHSSQKGVFKLSNGNCMRRCTLMKLIPLRLY